jgi:hypothetical protein
MAEGKGTTKKVVRRPLKPKDIKFVEAKAQGLPNYKAAMIASGAKTINSASTEANRMLKNATLRERLDEVLIAKGITLEKAVEPIQKALDYIDDDPRNELEMRLKGSDRALKVIGAFERAENPNSNTTINFNFNKND